MIQNDYDKFWARRFDYPKGVPFEFVSKFRYFISNAPYLNHEGKSAWQCSPTVASRIVGKVDEDLSFVEVGIIVNVLLGMPLGYFFDTPEQVISYVEELLDVRNYWNQKVERLNKEMTDKQARMMNLSGNTNAVNFNNKKN